MVDWSAQENVGVGARSAKKLESIAQTQQSAPQSVAVLNLRTANADPVQVTLQLTLQRRIEPLCV